MEISSTAEGEKILIVNEPEDRLFANFCFLLCFSGMVEFFIETAFSILEHFLV